MDDHLPSPDTQRVLEKSMVHIKNFLCISVCLPKQGIVMNDIGSMFGLVCKNNPTMSDYLVIDALKLRKKLLQKAMLIIMNREKNQLIGINCKAARLLRANSLSVTGTRNKVEKECETYFEKIQNKKRR